MAKLLQRLALFSILGLSVARSPLQTEDFRTRGFAGRGSEPQRRPSTDSSIDPIAPFYRLNGTIIPDHYHVDLTIILDGDGEAGEQFTAPGRVVIFLTPTENLQRITLHSYLIRVDPDATRVVKLSEPVEEINVISHSNETDTGKHFLHIDVDTVLEAGERYQLEIHFIAPISTNKTNGLYLSRDVDADGQERRQASTQMESIQARELFPCFDEPEYKATFTVTITRKKNYTALANGELLSTIQHPLPDWVIDTFNKTVPMPTYLFALFVSNFPYVEVMAGDVAVRVHGPREMIERGGGNYTVKATADVFDVFNELFDTPIYSFNKMDSVAVPMKGGAMENWALILYRWDLLMYFAGETTERKRYAITDVIAHEVAHQNFGNLVTCKEWGVLWLNEGFATYLSTVGVNTIQPEFQPWDLFLYDNLQYSMITDARNDTHPLNNENESETPDEIDNMFSTITYEKGGSIIRMMSHFLTNATLQKGLRYYLKDMEYKAAEQEDLYRNLQRAVDEDGQLEGLTVKEVLDSWTLQPGFPLVTVTMLNENSMLISQERFKANGAGQPPSSELWWVPITLAVGDVITREAKILPDFWLEGEKNSTVLELMIPNWVVVNLDGIGYFRTQYDTVLLNKIVEQLDRNHSVLTSRTRSQLLDDYFTLAFDERVSMADALNLTKYLENEVEVVVWNTVFTHFLKPYQIFQWDENEPVFRAYVLPRVEAALTSVGVEQSSEHFGAVAMNRERLMDWACSLNSSLCVNYAIQLLEEWEANPQINPINVDIRPIMQCAIAALKSEDGFDFLIAQFLFSESLGFRLEMLNALACAGETHPDRLDLLLSGFLDGNSQFVLQSEMQHLFLRLAADPWGSNVVFNLLTNRLSDVINVLYSGRVEPIGEVMMAMLKYINSQEIMDYMIFWFDQNAITFNPIRPTLNAAVNQIPVNILWTRNFGQPMADFMAAN